MSTNGKGRTSAVDRMPRTSLRRSRDSTDRADVVPPSPSSSRRSVIDPGLMIVRVAKAHVTIMKYSELVDVLSPKPRHKNE